MARCSVASTAARCSCAGAAKNESEWAPAVAAGGAGSGVGAGLGLGRGRHRGGLVAREDVLGEPGGRKLDPRRAPAAARRAREPRRARAAGRPRPGPRTAASGARPPARARRATRTGTRSPPPAARGPCGRGLRLGAAAGPRALRIRSRPRTARPPGARGRRRSRPAWPASAHPPFDPCRYPLASARGALEIPLGGHRRDDRRVHFARAPRHALEQRLRREVVHDARDAARALRAARRSRLP